MKTLSFPHPLARFATLLLLASLPMWAQAKRPLTHQDYDAWRSISSPTLSPDGKFLVYGLLPQEGDGEVVVRNLATGAEWRQPAGARPEAPRANPLAGLLPEAEPPRPRNVTVAFTPDSRMVVFSTFAPKAEVDKAKKAKKKPEDLPKGGMVIMDLATGAATRVDRVKSFELPGKDGFVLAYLKEAEPARRDEKTSGAAAEEGSATGRAIRCCGKPAHAEAGIRQRAGAA